MRPENYKYTESHEWVSLDGEIATVGISDFAVQELTDLIFVELPVPGSKVAKGEALGEIESVKTVAEFYSPLSGEVVEVNEDLPNNLDLFSESPFEKAWMVKIKVSNPSEMDGLLSREQYDEIAHS